ncbi:Zn-dependent exopeptidase M28 [Aeromicrobium sp. PE09-221]|uniref:M28 family metallopeptidase n=1 Tax=Aeromicrobium sp. PE09-221 TaxID=1898043 RepID=UPI000B3E7EBF|nr:M28 family peptidase [Aeromicrobium sp. PE09-221]OUZ07828.1 Zn-dependent exopeptidase M28 [Aeromicrobium sp. PE09-221]
MDRSSRPCLLRASFCALALGLVLLGGCTGSGTDDTPSPSEQTTASSEPTTPDPPPEVDTERVLADIGHLAETIGPRHGTSEAYAEAAAWVEGRLTGLGYEVTRQQVDAPAGITWGVDVPAGDSPNVIATRPGAPATDPHVVVGAHLDTIPVAPGAEDNASGVAVMLELARIVAESEVPVRFVAFGAEEPRGPGDSLHHFGSQQYVAALADDERTAITAMVALDRVGVPGPEVPICSGDSPNGTTAVRDQLATIATAGGVPHTVCGGNTTSDHWSFDKAGIPAARLGSIPYAGYHSPQDTVGVVDPAQTGRVATIARGWLLENSASP